MLPLPDSKMEMAVADTAEELRSQLVQYADYMSRKSRNEGKTTNSHIDKARCDARAFLWGNHAKLLERLLIVPKTGMEITSSDQPTDKEVTS